MKKLFFATVALTLFVPHAIAQDLKFAVEGNLGGLKFNFLLNNPHNYNVHLQAPGLTVQTIPAPQSQPSVPSVAVLAVPQPQPIPPVATAPPQRPQPEPQQPEVQLPPAPPMAEPPEPENKSTSEYFNPGMQSKDAVKPRPYQQQ